MNITLDTETSGLPTGIQRGRFPHYTQYQHYDSARIVSISWIVSKGDRVINQSYFIIKPNGFTISPDSIAIHGITNEQAHDEGHTLQHVIQEFQPWLEQAANIIAHNITFDSNVIMSEFHRFGRHDLVTLMKSKKFICTMKKGKQYMNYHKNPKLSELYEFLYHEPITNAHNAQADTYYCFKCFIKMFPSDTDKFFFRNNEVNLTDEQKQVVFEDPTKNMMVIACAGSGKSTTTLCRIKYLISQGTPENTIMLTTFTKDAAMDMQEKLVDIMGYKPACTVGTIDSIVRYYYLKYHPGKKDIKNVGEYGHDFLKMIRDEPHIISHYKYMFIDEFQDINDLQYEIIQEFYKNGSIIFGVGDDAQNIYTFRGSNVKYILNFDKIFENAKMYKLTYNFRSSPPIVEFANACIEKNNMNIPKQMVSANPVFQDPKAPLWKRPDVNYFVTPNHQAKKIIECIQLMSDTYKLHDIAILCPINQPLYLVEELLTAQGIKSIFMDGKADVRTSRKTGHVCLCTIHKSKGLEWDAVFLISMSDDLIPKVKTEKAIEEDRRVFYVGCTRAKKELFIYFTKSFTDGNTYVTRYVSEVPQDLFTFSNVYNPVSYYGKSEVDIATLSKGVTKLIELLDGGDYIFLKNQGILPVFEVKDIQKTKLYEAMTYKGVVKDEDLYADFGIFVDCLITREASKRFNIAACKKDKYSLRTLASVILEAADFKVYKLHKKHFEENLSKLNYLKEDPSEIQHFSKIQRILEENQQKISGQYLFTLMTLIHKILDHANKFEMPLEDIPVFNESFLPQDFESQMKNSLNAYADHSKDYTQIIDDIWHVSKCQLIVNERRRRLLFKKITGTDILKDYSTLFDNISIFLDFIAARKGDVNCRLDFKLEDGVYGEVDMIVGDTLIDYKTSINDEVNANWIAQLLCYKILCEKNTQKRYPIKNIGVFNPLRGCYYEMNIESWSQHMNLLSYLLQKREEQLVRSLE